MISSEKQTYLYTRPATYQLYLDKSARHSYEFSEIDFLLEFMFFLFCCCLHSIASYTELASSSSCMFCINASVEIIFMRHYTVTLECSESRSWFNNNQFHYFKQFFWLICRLEGRVLSPTRGYTLCIPDHNQYWYSLLFIFIGSTD